MKDIAVMMKPKDEEPVDWSKIYMNEEEFLEIDKSIESEVESEEEELSVEPIEYDQLHKLKKSAS